MERILTRAEMLAAEKNTVETLGIPEEELIARAGEAVASVIQKKFKGGRVLVVCGSGKNGKDGQVIAENLIKNHGFSVTVYDVLLDDARLLNRDYEIVVDCLFGTGLNRPLDGVYADVVNTVNKMGCFLVACDIPSGLSSDTGLVLGSAVKADLTVAVQDYKTGHFLNDAPDYTGALTVKDIGISVWGENFAYRLTDDDVEAFFPKRKRNANKGDFSRAICVGGSKAYSGAPLLALNAMGAFSGGVGYAALAVPASLFLSYVAQNPDLLLKTFDDDGSEMVFDEAFLSQVKGYPSLAFGMGLGTGDGVKKSLRWLLKNYEGKLLIDADGLTALKSIGLDELRNKKCAVVLTPHVKEFSRLTGKTVDEIKENTLELAKAFAKEYDVVLHVKSATSVTTDGTRVLLTTAGSTALAKGGSGDILSGLTAGLMTRETPFDAVSVAAYLLGKAGESAEKEYGTYATYPTMILDFLAKEIKRRTQNG